MISDHPCECGCGEYTNIAEKNHTRSGNVKGQPYRYVLGHSRPQGTSYFSIHKYIRRTYPKTGICEECGSKSFTEYAVIHGRSYSRNREDYRELCRYCHRRYDLSKLQWETVATIQARIDAGETIKALAREYGVDQRSIRTALRLEVPSLVVSS